MKFFEYPQELNEVSEKIECLCSRFSNLDNHIAGGFNTGHVVVYDVNDSNKNPMIFYENEASINTLR